MNINVPASELARMIRVAGKCIETRSESRNSNVELRHENGKFYIAANNGSQYLRICTDAEGGNGESIRLDGKTFAEVAGKCSGPVQISVNGNICTVQSKWRTRIPIVNAEISQPGEVATDTAGTVTVLAENLAQAVGNVMHAVSADWTRLILTGIQMRVAEGRMELTALDGFRLSKETVSCKGDDMCVIIPGAALKRFCDGTAEGEIVRITADGERAVMQTESVMSVCSLLHGIFPEIKNMIPETFKTETVLQKKQILDALKGSSAIGGEKHLVKFRIGKDYMQITSNSEAADFTAVIEAETIGEETNIAFNPKYVLGALGTLDDDEIVLKTVSAVRPAVFTTKNGEGIRIVLPVRVIEG